MKPLPNFENYRLQLQHYCLYKVGDFSLSEDLVQETFFKAWKCWHYYDPSKSGLYRWLTSILDNLIIDNRRKKINKLKPLSLSAIETSTEEGFEADHLEALGYTHNSFETLVTRDFIETLTEVEQKVLGALLRNAGDRKDAFADLGLSPKNGYKILRNIKERYDAFYSTQFRIYLVCDEELFSEFEKVD